ncbi:MAG: arginase [Bacteroidia bacterium]
MKNVKFITIESDFGAGKKGAKLGPQALLTQLKKSGVENFQNPEVLRVSAEDLSSDNLHPFLKNIDAIIEVQQRAIKEITAVLEEADKFPIILSGDHSNGSASIAAIKNLYPDKRLGVVWIDAHADLHNPFSTPSGNMHGMPLAAALGLKHEVEDKNEITDKELELWQDLMELGDQKISPKIQFEDLVFIDLRDLEEDEEDLINQHQIKWFSPAYRKEQGISKILEETLDYLKNVDLLLVSFDVDSLDPEISIGTGTPVPQGLSKDEAVILLSGLLKSPKIKAWEITEINPLLDRNHPMEEVSAELFLRIWNESIK